MRCNICKKNTKPYYNIKKNQLLDMLFSPRVNPLFVFKKLRCPERRCARLSKSFEMNFFSGDVYYYCANCDYVNANPKVLFYANRKTSFKKRIS